MKTTIVVLGLLAVFIGSLTCLHHFHLTQLPPAKVNSQGPTIEKLERLSHLVTTRVQIADVLVGEGQGCRGAWLIKGDALLAVNLGKAKITNKHDDTRQAAIILPQPEVLQPRVDHSRTRTWSVDRVAWLPWNTNQDALRDTVMAEAQRLVAHAAASAENIQTAKTNSEVVLKAIFAEVGWQISVTWADPPGEG